MAFSLRIAFAAVWLVVLSVGTSENASAQALTKAMVETYMKEWIAAYTSNDLDRTLQVDPPADGFGWRPLAARSAEAPLPEFTNTLKTFLGGMDYYRMQLDEIRTKVDGNIGLAWGVFTEDFKRKGRNPEKVRVRFTTTLKYENGKWETLLYHRDAQKFGSDGRYLADQ